MAEDVKVKAKLEFDTNAERILGEIKDDFEELGQEVKEGQSYIKDFFTTFAAMAAANLMAPMIQGMKDATGAAFSLASEAYDTQQAIAGMMDAMSGEGGKDWEIARVGAELLHGEFTQLSIDMGQLRSDIEAGHAALATFLGGTAEAFEVAERNLEGITRTANVTGFSVAELGGQFGKMAAGFLSTESPIFNLLRSTGIFADDITKVNQEWQKLTQSERIEKLEGAFSSISTNLEDAAPTMSDMLTSMKMIGQEFLESFGGTVIREVLDEMDALRHTLMDSGETFNEFATALGKDFAQGAVFAIEQMQAGIEYMRENADEIRDSIREAFTFAKDVIEFIVSNRDLIMVAFGAGAAAKAAGAVAGVAGAAGTGGVTGAVGTGLQAAGGAASGLMTAVIAGGPPMWALAAAITAAGAAATYMWSEQADQEAKMEKEIKDLMKAEETRMKQLTELSKEQYDAQYDGMLRIAELAEKLGEDSRKMVEDYEAIGKNRGIVRKEMVQPFEELLATFGKVSPELLQQQLDDAMSGAGPSGRESVEGGASEVGYLFEKAMKAQEMASAQVMVDLITGTSQAARNARTAFIEAGDMTVEGMKLMSSMIKAETGEGGETLKSALSAMIKQKSGVPKISVNNNFSGSTFKIQQEFRDQDPDRIAIAFEDRITRAAVNRTQASTSAPFGA